MGKIFIALLLIINFASISNTNALDIYIVTDSHNIPKLDCETEWEIAARTGTPVSDSCRVHKSMIEELKSWVIPPIKFILTIGFATALAFGMGKSADRISEKKSLNSRLINLLLFFLLLAIAMTMLIFDWLFVKYGVYWWFFIVTLSYFAATILRIIFLDYKQNHRVQSNKKIVYNSQSKNKPVKNVNINAVISQTELSAYLKEDLLILAQYYKVKCDDKDTKSIIKKKIISKIELKFSKNELFSRDKSIVFRFFNDLKSMYNKNRAHHKFDFKEMISKVEKHWSKL